MTHKEEDHRQGLIHNEENHDQAMSHKAKEPKKEAA